jgi:hypothetical protein
MRCWLPLLLLCLVADPGVAGDADALVARVTVREPGDYRITAAALKQVGIPSAAHAELRLYGQPVTPCAGAGEDLRLRVVHSGSRSSGLTTYELWRLSEARRIRRPSPGRPGPVFGVRILDRDLVYGELAAADPALYAAPNLPVWFLAAVSPRQAATLALAPPAHADNGQQRLTAKVYAAHRGRVALRATWGGADLGSASVKNAVGGADLEWLVPADRVPAGSAPLTLIDASPPPPPPPARDVSSGRRVLYVDSIRTSGTVSRLPSLTCEEEVTDLTPQPAASIPDPLALAGNAEHVILATPPLVKAARRLARHRSRGGLSSVVVPLADVYDGPYGYGNRSPNAIVKFIDALRKRSGARLRYVVLAGDATFDRTDFGPEITLPTPMARTMYNGATSADRLYTLPETGASGGPSIGRLPFRKAEDLAAYVDRLIAYETKPPVDPTRRLLRFITSEGRFGSFVDNLMERQFRSILAKDVPPAFDIEVTFASADSPFLWPPPAFNDKVLAGLNEGALFYTYVGHGFSQGFDTLHVGAQRYPILHVNDVPRVDVRGTPPIMLVLACTTAMFDAQRGAGIGESLLARPHGPIAYWGATRVCHPIYNTWIGQALAQRIAAGPTGARPDSSVRLGDILDAARDNVLANPPQGAVGLLLKNFAGIEDMNRLMQEGALMYTLLGDPALRVALPANDIEVEARVEGGEVICTLRAPLPEGTQLHVSLELPRNRSVEKATLPERPDDPAVFEQIRATHARMNDWALQRRVVNVKEGGWTGTLPLGDQKPKGLIVKAWALTAEQVHQGALRLP